MAESQLHGNLFEDIIIRDKTGMGKIEYDSLKPSGYTSDFDLSKGVGGAIEDISVKSAKRGSGKLGIGLGDIKRIWEKTDPAKRTESWTMVVGEYIQIGNEKKFTSIHEIKIDPLLHGDILRGEISTDSINDMCDWVKSIPHGNPGSKRGEWKQKRTEIFEKHQRGLLSIDAKIDSGSQRRVQTGVKLEEIIEHGVSHHKYDSKYGNIDLPFTIQSPSRKRNSKK